MKLTKAQLKKLIKEELNSEIKLKNALKSLDDAIHLIEESGDAYREELLTSLKYPRQLLFERSLTPEEAEKLF
jgi:hypothetical protein